MVSRPLNGSLKETYSEIIALLQAVNIEIFFFDEVVPNPTIEGVENGVSIAVKNKVDNTITEILFIMFLLEF